MTCPVHAAEQTNENDKLYRKHINQGKACFQKGQFACCKTNFESAYELKPKPVLLFSVGECLERTDQYLEAIEYFRRYLEEEDKPKHNKKWVRKAKEKLLDLPTLLSRLNIKIDPEDAEVTLDGHPRTIPEQGVIHLNPGQYVVTATRKGYKRFQTTLALLSGRERSLSVKLFREQATLSVECDDSDATVLLDGKSLGKSPIEIQIAPSPSPHELIVTAHRKQPYSEQIHLGPGQRIRKLVTLEDDPRRRRIAGWSTAVCGVLSEATLVIMDITLTTQTRLKKRDANNAFTHMKTFEGVNANSTQEEKEEAKEARKDFQESVKTYHDTYQRYQAWMKNPGRIAGYAVGGALIVSGALLIFFSIDKKPTNKVSVRPTTGGVIVDF